VKYSKVAAAVAGSLMAVGVAAPAFADSSLADSAFADNMSTMPTSINGGLDQALNAQPLQKAVDDTAAGGMLNKVSGSAQALRRQTSALRSLTSAGSLPGRTTDAVKGSGLSALTGAVPGASLLGGLPLGGLPLGGLPLGGLPLGGLPLGGLPLGALGH
jgi:hypothetical protein